MKFEQALLIAGLHPRDILPDGKIRRCTTEAKPKDKTGWYVLHPDGHGVWGDWSTGSSTPTGSWKDDNATAMAVDPAVLARMQRQREQDRQYRIQAVRSARAFWRDSSALSLPHPYVADKGLQPLGCAGLRINDGLLVVPVMLGESLISVQTIAPDGDKQFWPGASVKAGAYTLSRPRSAITVLVEGLATGLAVFQAVRSASVIVCFNAGNLLPVVERVKPTGSVVIAADNDWKTMLKRGMNPGIYKATNAAELIGCGVAWPTGIEGSDFCDLLKEAGASGSRQIERTILAAAKYVMAHQ